MNDRTESLPQHSSTPRGVPVVFQVWSRVGLGSNDVYSLRQYESFEENASEEYSKLNFKMYAFWQIENSPQVPVIL